ncbi:hypothetical protein GHY26_16195 [Salmonella enterica]|nr:hypothetical protein [Salmonella enterica]EDN2304054.1 hypothetical protein [Salmonella enterica subsp. diarizonae serovar 65:(k):z]
MRRHAEPFRYFSNRIAPLGDLADSLFLKFRGKTWCAHRLLLCSNYRADLSTGSGALQIMVLSVFLRRHIVQRFMRAFTVIF